MIRMAVSAPQNRLSTMPPSTIDRGDSARAQASRKTIPSASPAIVLTADGGAATSSNTIIYTAPIILIMIGVVLLLATLADAQQIALRELFKRMTGSRRALARYDERYLGYLPE